MNVHVFTLIEDVEEALSYAPKGIRLLLLQPPEPFEVWSDGKERTLYLDGAERAMWIRKVHQKVSDVVGFAPVWRQRHAPCPECGLPYLGSWSGTEVIECRNEECLVRYTLEEYATYEYATYCMAKAKNEG